MATTTPQPLRNSFVLMDESSGEIIDIITQADQAPHHLPTSCTSMKGPERIHRRASSNPRPTRWRDSEISLHTLSFHPEGGATKRTEGEDTSEREEPIDSLRGIISWDSDSGTGSGHDRRYLTFKRDPSLVHSLRSRTYLDRPDAQAKAGGRAGGGTAIPESSGTARWSAVLSSDRRRPGPGTRTSFGGSSFYTALDDHLDRDDDDPARCGQEGGVFANDEVGMGERLELFSVPHPDDVS